ncbi:MAG: hypothetical protein PHR83_17015 [Paludibacter sp.]|nr:hypothetical protein [Paludibacter sp.]
MDYREHLLRPLSKRFVDHLVAEIFIHPTDFDIVYQLVFDKDMNVAWRAAWACQKISDKHPEWFGENHFSQLAELSISTSHGGLQRGCLSVLNNLPMPATIPVELINTCFEWMVSAKSSIATQALSMKLLLKICAVEPDFKAELRAYLENIDYYNYSAGFNSTRRNVLKALNHT